jgi:hypothetical protein
MRSQVSGEDNITSSFMNSTPHQTLFRRSNQEWDRKVGHMACTENRKGAYRVLVRRPEGKRPLGRHRYRWEDNVKMILQDVGWRGTDWIDLAQDRSRWLALVNAVMNLQVP